eukprot:11203318-Alexandrium_andersonii.AAC.1
MTTWRRRSAAVTAFDGFRAFRQPCTRWTTASITCNGRPRVNRTQRSPNRNSAIARSASRQTRGGHGNRVEHDGSELRALPGKRGPAPFERPPSLGPIQEAHLNLLAGGLARRPVEAKGH